MSSTRRQTGDGPFRQERFASSQEFERGLMANLVAKRCSILERGEDRELIWFIQLLSHRPGGLKHLADTLCEQFPERIATPSMRKFGMQAGQVYSAKQVRQVRGETAFAGNFPLRDDEPSDDCLGIDALLAAAEKSEDEALREMIDRQSLPTSYPAASFIKICRMGVAKLADHLAVLSLDPAQIIADGSPWYFPGLVSTLREYQAQWIADNRPKAVTSIGRRVGDALDYALESRRLVLVDGMPRLGKSEGAKAWCSAHPGRARYVACPPTNDDFTFFRDIALSLGVSINLKSKAQELRNRIEETLRGGDLALVIDEAHYLWPQSHYRNTMPGRVNWLMTALVNNGVAVALITTPQFFRSQRAIEQATCWTSEQFTGRIGHYEKLPDTLSEDDFAAVAAALLPTGDARSLEALVTYAQSTDKQLGAIDAIASRASFIARRAGRDKVLFADVRTAIKESVIPSDAELAKALTPPANAPRKRAAKVFAQPLQPEFSPTETGREAPLHARQIIPGAMPESRRVEMDFADENPRQLQAKPVPG